MAEQGGSDKTQHQNNNEQREKNTATLSKINNAIKACIPIKHIFTSFLRTFAMLYKHSDRVEGTAV